MPRKQKIVDNTEKKVKKNLMNTMVKNINKEEHIILQLPLTQQKVNSIINNNNDDSGVPIPYEPNCCYINDNDDTNDNNKVFNFNNINDTTQQTTINKKICCFWCCHLIDYMLYGLPINYDSINDNYIIYGSFCSLQCANAYNFSVHSGSDKVWEINSMIQMMAKRYGINEFIRPAPSRYLLKMFNGKLEIDEFRRAHLTNDATHILNLPPMISVSSGYENVNTSYLSNTY